MENKHEYSNREQIAELFRKELNAPMNKHIQRFFDVLAFLLIIAIVTFVIVGLLKLAIMILSAGTC